MPTRSLRLLVPALAIATASCAPIDTYETDQEDHHEEWTEVGEASVFSGTVEGAVGAGCQTGLVEGLSLQIIEEGACIDPEAFARLPSRPNLSFGANAYPYLVAPARDAMVKALDANPSKHMGINSMLRTVAQQYLLYRWSQKGKCGIGLAAKPGNSNHETGLAFDTSDYNAWKNSLPGFRWFGSKDRVHFDYNGPGAVSQKGLDVLAFQRLHNRNNPNDQIEDDGLWGTETLKRMQKAPAQGFALGPSCQEVVAEDSEEEPAGEACGPWADITEFTCSQDGTFRGVCEGGTLVSEECPQGCALQSGEDVCQ